MPLLAVVALAAMTYAFRIAGPLLRDRVTVPPAAQRLFTSAAAVLLVALAATSALATGHDFAGWARPGWRRPASWPLAAPRSPSSWSPRPLSPPCCGWEESNRFIPNGRVVSVWLVTGCPSGGIRRK